MSRAVRSVAMTIVAASVGFGLGFFLRGRSAQADIDASVALNGLVSAYDRAARDRFALVMIGKGRIDNYVASSERQLAEDLKAARKAIESEALGAQPLTDQFPWLDNLLPNLVTEFRRSAEQLDRSGKYADAAADGRWVADRLDSLAPKE